MKHYMDINNLREKDERIGDILIPNNAAVFEVGDHIQITEKYDGSNASIENINGHLESFTSRNPCTFENSLNGFYQFAKMLEEKGATIPAGLVVFGEWSGAKNRIYYEKKGLWLIFDIYDRNQSCYWPQSDVKAFCEEHGLDYIHELYNGPFVSWDHCRSFMNMPFYGNRQEGVVVKNQDKLRNSTRFFYLKIVNKDFKERNLTKVIDPEKQAAIETAHAYMESVVTPARVEKMIFKLRDEGILGSTLTPLDLKTISQHLPKRIFEDCLKEEPETVEAAGQYAGKQCASIATQIAREFITKNTVDEYRKPEIKKES